MTANDLSLISSLFNKRFKDSKLVDLEQAPAQGTPGGYIPTGSISLNLAIGVGGFKKGTLNEIFGPESSGKSTLVMDVVREAQRMFPDKPAVYLDVEQAFPKTYAEQIGIDLSKERLLLCQPSETEETLNMAQFFAEQGASLVVVDSVAAMVPKDQMESGDSVDAKMGGNSKAMSTHLAKMIKVCAETDTVVLYVNQVRDNIAVMFGSPETTPGGKGLKFYASLRIRTSVRDRIKDPANGGAVHGVLIKAEVKKNKIGGAPYRWAEYPILFGQGIDRVRDLADLAIEKGLLGSGAGGRYVFGETKLHGKPAVYQYLRDNPDAARALTDTIWSSV